MGIKGSLNLIEEISMAYIDVDKDIRYYTDPLDERIDELEHQLVQYKSHIAEQMQDVDDELMTLTNQITGLLVLLKSIGD